ncbi:MAG: hypothetical protein NTZ93_03195 [Candidatus Beckwithbacteria bacterium]|nr:hypothetical protein [Candidatus Beckwithbacteria bacterium]
MKFFRYLLAFLTILIFILAIYFGFFKTKNKEHTILSPIAEVTTQKTSNFSLEKAPTESLKGKIVTMTGEISWQSRTATEAARIFSPSEIQQGEKLITGEKSNLALVFTEACSVTLSEKTEMEIVQTLPANIVFSQTNGTGEYVKTGGYPVTIRVMNLLAEEDGDMIVSIDPKKPIISLTLRSGKATAAFNDLNYVSHEMTVVAGQTFIFNYDTRKGVLK